ncbi:MAG: flagellar hook-associated protein 3 FlgL [Alcanivorax sp.]|jgi:flagellar hook-associated protein 3 FlgL
MRLSSLQIFQQGISAITAQQSRLTDTQQQLATGKRILTPSDDPAAASRILDISEDLRLLDQYARNGNMAQAQLSQEELVLADVGTLLQRVRELVVQANNATQSPESRGSIGTEISARLDELQALANTRDSNGEYIFAGFQADTQPFTRQGSVTYNGDAGQRFLQLGSGSRVAVRDSGIDVFMSSLSGNGVFDVKPGSANSGTLVAGSSTVDGSFLRDNYTVTFNQATPADPITYQVTDGAAAVVAGGPYVAGEAISFAGARIEFDGVPDDGDIFSVTSSVKQDVFSTLQSIADQLNGAGGSAADVAAINNGMGRALNNLDQAMDQVLQIRTSVGVRLNQVESQQAINEGFNLQLQSTLSDVQDLDYAEAISRFNLELTALEAAQQSYVKMQGLSLFNFL